MLYLGHMLKGKAALPHKQLIVIIFPCARLISLQIT